MSALIPETSRRLITPETLLTAAKQSSKCNVIPVRLRSAIDKFLQEQEMGHMKKKVLRLSESFGEIKDANRLLPSSLSKELVEDPLKSMEHSKRWKIKSVYGDIGLTYTDDQTVAYVATRMPAVYAASKVLDFGSGTGSAFWALREVWPRSLKRINLIEPSQSMQRAGASLSYVLGEIPSLKDRIAVGASTMGSYARYSDTSADTSGNPVASRDGAFV
ncbi:Methyltransferase-like protein 17 mitochondrial [Bienertia sinuspersici]